MEVDDGSQDKSMVPGFARRSDGHELRVDPAASTAVDAMPSPQETPVVDTPATTPVASPDAPNQRAEAVRLGKWPAQVAASQGAIQPDLHGPQRNDPAEGIPAHAYSPFDERRNREYPCPPGGCDFETGQVLVKLAAGVEVASLAQQEAAEFTGDAALDAALSSQGDRPPGTDLPHRRAAAARSDRRPGRPGAAQARPHPLVYRGL